MPPVLGPPETFTPAIDGGPSFARRLAASAVRLVVIVLFSALLGAGWYLAKKGFGRQWRSRVVEELRKRGVEASVRRLTLDPFRGLIAQDVRIFDYRHRENTLARISEVSLDINYAALFHHEPFLNALDVRNAQLTLPRTGAKGKMQKPQLKNFRAHIYFPPEQIYVSQAEGIFCGIRISATGQLIKRENYRPSPPLSEEEWQRRLSTLEDVVSELQKFTFAGEMPQLQVKFSGDLAAMENARFEATLRGKRIRRGKYEISNLLIGAEFAEQRLNVMQFGWKDSAGAFSGSGNWNRRSHEMNFEARSNIDVKALLEAFGAVKLLSDATFHTPPAIELSGAGRLGEGRPQVKVIGHVRSGDFAWQNVPFLALKADFAWDGERTLLQDVRVQHQSGQLNADVLNALDDFRLNLDSTINPAALRAFAPPELKEFAAEWEWQRSPTVHLAIRGSNHDPKTWSGDGTVALDRTRFRGVWMNGATASVHFKDGAVTYDNLRVTRDEGTGSGTFTYDFKNHEVRLTNVKSTLRPAEVIFWIDPKLWKTVTPYKFRQPPNITANGVYQFQGGRNTRLDLSVDAPNGMDYTFLGKSLPFDHVSGKLVFTRDRLQIADLKSTLFSGAVRGGAEISLARNDSHYHASISVNGIDFPRLTDLYYQYKTTQGRLNGSYDFTGLGSDARTMRGTGKLEVTNGDVFAIPIFGPLSEILDRVLPGSGYSIARKVTSSVAVKDGIIHTDDFEAAGKLFGMVGHGDIHFLDDKLDFDLRIDPNGPGVLLAPMYKLFEYTGEGSLNHPDWHPKRF